MTAPYDARPLPLTDPSVDTSTLAYWDYHGLAQLLSAKRPLTASADEDLFICVHQVCELSFHQMILDLDRSLAATAAAFGESDGLPAAAAMEEAVYFLARVPALYDTVNRTMPILTGLRAFQEFRTAIGASSGFQSWQFRRLEIMSGVDHPYWRGGTSDASGLPHVAERELDRQFGAAIADWFETYRDSSLASLWRVAIARTGSAAAAAGALPHWAEQLRRYEAAQLRFHRAHLGLAAAQLKKVGADIGTGGTDFRAYLTTYEREVAPLFPGLDAGAA